MREREWNKAGDIQIRYQGKWYGRKGMGGKAIILYTPTTWPGGSQFLRQYKGAIQKVMRVQLTSFHLCSENPVPESVVENINSISSCLRGGERCKIRGNVQRSRHFALHLPGQEASQGWKCMPKSSRGESCGKRCRMLQPIQPALIFRTGTQWNSGENPCCTTPLPHASSMCTTLFCIPSPGFIYYSFGQIDAGKDMRLTTQEARPRGAYGTVHGSNLI